MKQYGLALVLLGAVLALGFTIAAQITSSAIVKINSSESIRVKGSAVKMVKSDIGSWSGHVKRSAPTMQEAAKKLDVDLKIVQTFLKLMGFEDKEISFSGIDVRTIYKRDARGNVTDEINSYELSRSVMVGSDKVELIEKLSKTFTDLLRQDVFVSSDTPCFLITKLDDYKFELLGAATENARKRAEILATNTNGKAGKLRNASQGIFQVLAPGGSDISDYGTYDKTTIMKEVKAVVTLEFVAE